MSAQYSTNEPGFVYLIHLHQPLNAHCQHDKRTVKHYIGWCKDLAARIQSHERGRGSSFMRAVKAHDIPFTVARVWQGDRKLERTLKNQKNAARFCPCCSTVHPGLTELSQAQIQNALIGF